jgi:hypothetical protein
MGTKTGNGGGGGLIMTSQVGRNVPVPTELNGSKAFRQLQMLPKRTRLNWLYPPTAGHNCTSIEAVTL